MKFNVRREESTENKNLRFPKTLLDRARLVAQKNGISLNKLVMQSLEYALENMEEENSDNDEQD